MRSARLKVVLLATTLAGSGLFPALPARAQCDFAPTAGDDLHVCESGTSPGGLTDLGGDNTLLFPEGGTGILDGDVEFGAGADRIEMFSGTITGVVDQGDGNDIFIIHDGTVLGDVQQGLGIDEFVMTGGVIQSLHQGDHHDFFFMSGGRIIDAFEDGDEATMTGGRIGRVNLKLDNNIFEMSGGTIDRNLVAGFGNDTITLSDGFIGGNISVSSGTDIVTITGGAVGGSILLGMGNDDFVWDDGGIVYGVIDLGPDDDTATLANLTDANLGATPQISGGLGIDTLVLDNVATGEIARFDGWETIELTNDTRLIFDQTLVLGDAGTGTGSLHVDAASMIFAGSANSGVSAFAAGQLVDVFNAGRIDLTNGGDGTSDTFTVGGNYIGDNGLLFLNTVLDDDDSASDRLVIDGGTASGTTGIGIFNVGGGGAPTTRNGILVVEALDGGSTASGAFALSGRVAAGAFEYFLFRGGVTAGTGETWYLRSTLVTPTEGPSPELAPAPDPLSPQPQPQPGDPEVADPPPPLEQPAPPLLVDPDDPDQIDSAPAVEEGDPEPVAPPVPAQARAADPPPPPPPTPTELPPLPIFGAAPPTPGATPVIADIVPLYRIEVPTYAVIQPSAHYLALAALGTFHERRGEQILLQEAGHLPASWVRILGRDIEMKWDGTVAPSFDGRLTGFQVGQDLIGWDATGGHVSRAGVFAGHARMDGTVRGQALGWHDLTVGNLDLVGTSFGGYWTHIGPEGWYLDGVLMGTLYDGDATSRSGVGIDIGGTAATASLEAGYPAALNDRWTLEPQGQLIWNHVSLDDRSDLFSAVSFDGDHALTARLGLRLQGSFDTEAGTIQPYVRANLWHDFASEQTVSFADTPIVSNIEGTSLEIGGGVVANLTGNVSLFATADYSTNLGGERRQSFGGNIGLSIRW